MRQWSLRIRDMLEAIESIQTFLAGHTADSLKKDRKTLWAAIRGYEIIGEAAAHMPPDIKSRYPDVPWRKAADMRNKLTHEYFGVDAEILFNTAEEDLPDLKRRLEAVDLPDRG